MEVDIDRTVSQSVTYAVGSFSGVEYIDNVEIAPGLTIRQSIGVAKQVSVSGSTSCSPDSFYVCSPKISRLTEFWGKSPRLVTNLSDIQLDSIGPVDLTLGKEANKVTQPLTHPFYRNINTR